MDQLINQTKFKFSGRSGADESSSSKGKQTSPQKPVSFKPEIAEKKRSPSWLRRQFSGKNNVEDDSNGIEQVTAMAAAVIAIASMEDLSIPQTKVPRESIKPTLTRRISVTGSRKVPTSDSSKVPESSSGEASKKSKDKQDKVVPEEITPASDDEKPEKIARPALQMERNPSFVDTEKTQKKLTETTTKKDEKPSQQEARSDSAAPVTTSPSPFKPRTTPARTESQRTPRPGTRLARADEWEKQELAKIKERYEQSKETILSWENKNKAKAKSRLYKREKELETKRLTALKEYGSEMENVSQVAEGARAKAAEKLRNEELKAKEKANKIRKTGKVPRGCFCF